MTDIQKQAIKDLLHLLIDKEEPPVISELLGKLPPLYAGLALAIFAAANPVVQSSADKAIEGIK